MPTYSGDMLRIRDFMLRLVVLVLHSESQRLLRAFSAPAAEAENFIWGNLKEEFIAAGQHQVGGLFCNDAAF